MPLCFPSQNFALKVELVEYVSPNDLVASLAKERLVPDDVAWKRCMSSCLYVKVNWKPCVVWSGK
jgi:hypothetical protein